MSLRGSLSIQPLSRHQEPLPEKIMQMIYLVYMTGGLHWDWTVCFWQDAATQVTAAHNNYWAYIILLCLVLNPVAKRNNV